MSDLVRVRLENGHETSVGREHAEASGLEVLKGEAAYNGDGTVRPETRRDSRPVKPKTTVSTEAAKRGAKASSDAEEATA